MFSPPAFAGYELEADHLEVKRAENSAVFSGNVHVWSDTRDIKARRMEVYYEQGGNEIRQVDAYGEVELIQPEMQATAAYMSYSVRADTAFLQEEARVEEERGWFEADWIWIDLAGENLEMKGNITGKLFESGEN
ncbi:MAG: LptA/OstA family protein [bacterium]